ncbi:hypothetical protein ACH4KV_24100 [Streptomyces albidoflavus]
MNESLAELTFQVAEGRAASIRRAAEIRRLRQEDPTHWTQTRLAEEAGISQAAVQRILTKDIHPRLGQDSREVLCGRLLGVCSFVDRRIYAQKHRDGAADRIADFMMGNVWEERVFMELRQALTRDFKDLSDDDRALAQQALDEIDALADGRPLHGPRMNEVELSRMVHAHALQRRALKLKRDTLED